MNRFVRRVNKDISYPVILALMVSASRKASRLGRCLITNHNPIFQSGHDADDDGQHPRICGIHADVIELPLNDDAVSRKTYEDVLQAYFGRKIPYTILGSPIVGRDH